MVGAGLMKLLGTKAAGFGELWILGWIPLFLRIVSFLIICWASSVAFTSSRGFGPSIFGISEESLLS